MRVVNMNESEVVMTPLQVLNIVDFSRRRGFVAGVIFSATLNYCWKNYKRLKAESTQSHCTCDTP